MNATAEKCEKCGKYVHCPEHCPECGKKAVYIRHPTGFAPGCHEHGIFPVCLFPGEPDAKEHS
jgi:rRNA maturation protein Nop10